MRSSNLDKKLLAFMAETPMSAAQLATKAGISLSSVRNFIKVFEESKEILRTDERMPYVYTVNPEAPSMVHKHKIQGYKKLLLNKEPTENLIVQAFRAEPKGQWISIADEIEAIITAVRTLHGEGKLIDTLESKLES